MLETATGTKMTHVPYKEMSQLYVAVGNQEVDWAFGSAASAGAMQRAAARATSRWPRPSGVAGFPDVPTVAESGGPGGL